MSLGIFEGGIEFSDVVFCYPSCPFPNVLSNVSFKVHPKQTVALIGLSGCGKSTILKLIQRLYNIQEGMVNVIGNMKISACIHFNSFFISERYDLITWTENI